MECKISTFDVRDEIDRIKIRLEGMEVDFRLAKEISKLVAAKKGLEMIIAWYDPEKDHISLT
jgi:hypothetical protein